MAPAALRSAPEGGRLNNGQCILRPVTLALRVFEREWYKAFPLGFILTHITEHKEKLEDSLTRALAQGGPSSPSWSAWPTIPVRDFQQFQRMALDSVTICEVALFWRAFEAYRRTHPRGYMGEELIIDKCPGFRVRCHRNHQEAHVLTILKAVRDREIHPYAMHRDKAHPGEPPRLYKELECDRRPGHIILQRVVIYSYPDRGVLFLEGGLNPEEQRTWIESQNLRLMHREDITFGEFLVREAADCIRSFDGLGKGQKGTPALPLVYPAPPEGIPTPITWPWP